MGIYRQFNDEQKESHLEQLSAEAIDKLREWMPAKSWRIHIHEPGTFLDWHVAHGNYIITVLSGLLEITVTDGTVLLCEPGTMRMTSDKEGRGHIGRAVGDDPCVVLMVDMGE